MNRKTVAVVLLVACVLGSMTGRSAMSVVKAASQSLIVAIDDSYPGDAPQYTLTFTLGTTIQKGDTLTLTFDSSVGMANGLQVDKALVNVDGITLAADATWQAGVLSLVSPLGLTAGTEHTVIISDEAYIQNPVTIGHYRITLSTPSGAAMLTSNYYSVTKVTQLVPLTFEKVVEYGELTGVKVTFKTGRAGALVGHSLIRNAAGLMVFPTTEDTMTIRMSAGLSTLWNTTGSVNLWPLNSSPFAMTVRSNTIYETNDAGVDLRQLVLNLPHNIPANMQVSIYLVFATPQDASAVSDAEYVKMYTSKEPALVMIPPQPASSGSQPSTTGTADTTPPVVTWTSSASTLLPRLVTIHITITEDNLSQAYFATGEDESLHTWLAAGENTLMMINRRGIKGTIIATDKAGNTTSIVIDIPAPASS